MLIITLALPDIVSMATRNLTNAQTKRYTMPAYQNVRTAHGAMYVIRNNHIQRHKLAKIV